MTSRLSLVELGRSLDLLDLATGLNACIEIVVKGRDSDDLEKLRRWATALMRYASQKGEVPSALKWVKSYFARCREFAINRGEEWGTSPPVPRIRGWSGFRRRELLHQISRVSRTLREPTSEMVSESLKDHRELSRCPFETPESRRTSFRAFVRRHFGGDVMTTFGSLGTAASFSRKMRDGGAPSEVRDITDAFRAKELSIVDLRRLTDAIPSFISSISKVIDWELTAVYYPKGSRARNTGFQTRCRLDSVLFPYDKECELSEEDWEVTREWLFSITAAWFSLDLSRLPRCRQVAVKERGFKVRVATPIEACERYLLSMINIALLSKLEECPQVVSALHGCPAEELDWTIGSRGHLVFSADLKSATDYLPQDLMADAVNVLSEEWPDEVRSLFLRAVGPHEMFSVLEHDSWVTSRGILMGSPVSWPLLSIYSAWLHSESGSNGWYAVCGDDYVGCHTYPSYRKYLEARESTGAVGSPGKDILGRESVGVFAEELLTVGRCRWVPTVSVRAVLGDPKSGKPAWTQGPEVSTALRRVVPNSNDCHRICGRLHADTVSLLRRNGIDPFAPRWIGGAGFPGIPSSASLRRARQMVSQAPSDVINWITQLEMVWNTTASSPLLGERVQQDLQRCSELSTWDSGRPGEWGPLRDVISSRLGSLSWAYFLAGVESRKQRVKLSAVSRVSSRVRESIAQKGYWVPHERITHGEGIAELLDSLEPLIRPPVFTSFLKRTRLIGCSSRRDASFLPRKRHSGPGSSNWGPEKRRRLV